jgi:hypothetical protein
VVRVAHRFEDQFKLPVMGAARGKRTGDGEPGGGHRVTRMLAVAEDMVVDRGPVAGDGADSHVVILSVA